MAVPKKKVSRSRRDSRRSSNFNATAPTLVECQNCKSLKVAHKVCSKCGSYDGKIVIEKKDEKKD